MGGHMARNLIKKGYPLIVYDVSKDLVNSLKESGNFSVATIHASLCNLRPWVIIFSLSYCQIA